MLDESNTDGAKCRRKMLSGRKIASAIRSLVNARGLQLENPRVLRDSLLLPVLLRHGGRRKIISLGLYRGTTLDFC